MSTYDDGYSYDEQPRELVLDFGTDPTAEPSYDLIPKGKHRGTVFSLTFGTSKSSNNPMFTCVVRLSDAPYNGRRLTTYFPLTKEAIWKLRAFLLSFAHPSYTAEALTGQVVLPSPDILQEDFQDQEVEIDVDHELYQGETRAKIKNVRGLASVPHAPSAPAVQAAVNRAQRAATLVDDELPF